MIFCFFFVILCKFGLIFVFFGMVLLIKVIVDIVFLGEVVFFRLFFVIFVIVGWLWFCNELVIGFKIDNLMGYFWCGLVGMMVMGFYFMGFGLLLLFEVIVIGYVVFLFIVIFVVMFLGE